MACCLLCGVAVVRCSCWLSVVVWGVLFVGVRVMFVVSRCSFVVVWCMSFVVRSLLVVDCYLLCVVC